MPTKSQVEIYRVLTDIVLKVIITLVVVFCFAGGLIFLAHLIQTNHSEDNIKIVGIFDGAITVAFGYILIHFFPKAKQK